MREFQRGEHAAEVSLAAGGKRGGGNGRVRRICGERRGMGSERMTREIEAEHLFFVGLLLAVVPFGHVGQVRRAGRGSRFVVGILKQSFLAGLTIGKRRGAGLQRPIDRGEELRAPGAERIECPGFDQALDRRAIGDGRIDAGTEIEQAAERSIFTPCRDDSARRVSAAALDRGQPKHDLPLGDGEIGVRAIHVRIDHFDIHPPAIFEMLDERILFLEIPIGNVPREQRRHEFDRIMGLEIGRHVGDQGIGGRMAFVEAVAGEFFDQAEEFRRLALA